MCKDTQIKLSLLKTCALHPQISPSPQHEVLQEKQVTWALLALHTAWMEECNLRLSLGVLMNLGSHHIGVNQFVFAFLSSFRLPSAFWIGRAEMKEKRRRCQMGEAHHPQQTVTPTLTSIYWRGSESGTWKNGEFVSYSTRLGLCSHCSRYIILQVPDNIFILHFSLMLWLCSTLGS